MEKLETAKIHLTACPVYAGFHPCYSKSVEHTQNCKTVLMQLLIQTVSRNKMFVFLCLLVDCMMLVQKSVANRLGFYDIW